MTAVICLFLFCLPAVDATAQPRRQRPAPRYVQLGEPDQAEGREILRDFRARDIAGEYYFDFALRVMPRRGDERVVNGRMWGSRNAKGPVSRVALQTGPGGGETRLLIQGGPQASAWRWSTAVGGAVKVDAAALFEPLGGTDLTAFDLQMPFLFWNDFVFEGVEKLRGRPAHAFLLYPPDEVAVLRPDLVGIRVYLDTQFGALVQAEQIGEGDKVIKSMSVVELKKVGEQWIVKAVDLRDEATRNKTRFQVTAAALSQKFPAKTFEPGALTESLSSPSASKLVRIAP